MCILLLRVLLMLVALLLIITLLSLLHVPFNEIDVDVVSMCDNPRCLHLQSMQCTILKLAM